MKTVLGFPSAALLVGLVTMSCGGDASSNKPSSPSGGCTSESECDEPSTGGSHGSGGAATQCTDATSAGTAAPEHRFANWPMPHPAESDLPNSASYDTSQADVVIDNVTGLMWQRETSDPQSYEEAASYCGELAAGGFCDWRLPTRIELVSLVDFTRSLPAIDPTFLVSERIRLPSSSEGHTEDSHFGVDVAAGNTNSTSQGGSVLCVRGAQVNQVPEPRYVFEGQGSEETVTDTGTGLVWQRRISADTYSFETAQTHCASLDLPGSGWRVPSVKELQTIIDETQPAAPFADTGVFPDFPPFEGKESTPLFWTSTFALESRGPWFVNFQTGMALPTSGQLTHVMDSELYVRCVR